MPCFMHSPVFRDANLAKAVPQAVWGAMLNMGQNCNAGSRTYVDEAIYDDFVAKCVEFAKTIVSPSRSSL